MNLLLPSCSIFCVYDSTSHYLHSINYDISLVLILNAHLPILLISIIHDSRAIIFQWITEKVILLLLTVSYLNSLPNVLIALIKLMYFSYY